jgi:hypothetical protein
MIAEEVIARVLDGVLVGFLLWWIFGRHEGKQGQ